MARIRNRIAGAPSLKYVINMSDQTVLNNTWTKILQWSPDFERELEFDERNAKFTCDQEGIYYFNAHIAFKADSEGTPITETTNATYQEGVAIYKNGSLVHKTGTHTEHTYVGKGVSISAPLQLVRGDYVEIYGFVRDDDNPGDTEYAIPEGADGIFCWLSIVRLF